MTSIEHGPASGTCLRVAIVCSGMGRVVRGFERFFQELATALCDRVDVRVFAGRLPAGLRGASVPCTPRALLGRIGFAPERAYYWEQLSFGMALLPHLVASQPHVVHLSDPALTNILLRARHLIPGRPRLLYCNGAPISPAHYRRYDHVQLVAPWQLDEASRSGIEPSKITFIPHGIDTARFQHLPPRAAARSRLGLPEGLLAISVAALNASHKRVDYLIREFARPASAPWTLLCLGQPTAETPALRQLARKAGSRRVVFRTAPPEEVPLYLAAADVFVLASKNEGFGLAAVEAMAAGLPVVVRDVPSLRYVVDDDQQVDPLLDEGALCRQLVVARDVGVRRERGERNRARAVEVFDWKSVLPDYVRMYHSLVGSTKP